MQLETGRLILREMTDMDYDALYRVLGDSDIMRHYPYTFDEARVKNWIFRNRERYATFGFGLWAAVEKRTGEMIGDCGLSMQTIHGVIRPEIGYHIRRDRQRQGFATEAARACRDWAFQTLPFQELYSYMGKENIASAATARANSMRLADAYTDMDGAETVVYKITRAQWRELVSRDSR